MDLRLARKWNHRNARKEFALCGFIGENYSLPLFWFGADRPTPAKVEAATDMLAHWSDQ